jgi:hypothetical protein
VVMRFVAHRGDTKKHSDLWALLPK